jgi:hypothetical protein
MANMKKCDRCGQPYDLYTINGRSEQGTAILIQGVRWDFAKSYNERNTVELCKSCAESFNEWLKNVIVTNED